LFPFFFDRYFYPPHCMYSARADNISKYNHIVKKIKAKSEVKVFDMRLYISYIYRDRKQNIRRV